MGGWDKCFGEKYEKYKPARAGGSKSGTSGT